MADRGFGDRAEEDRRKLRVASTAALARVAREQALAGRFDGLGELQGLGVGTENAQRQGVVGAFVEADALGVEQQRIRTGGRGEVALGESDERGRAKPEKARGI